MIYIVTHISIETGVEVRLAFATSEEAIRHFNRHPTESPTIEIVGE